MGVSGSRQQLQPIPRQVRSLDGQTVDTSGSSWTFRSSIDGGQILVLGWTDLDEAAVLSERSRHCVKLYLPTGSPGRKP
jgi:hypothetical protein